MVMFDMPVATKVVEKYIAEGKRIIAERLSAEAAARKEAERVPTPKEIYLAVQSIQKEVNTVNSKASDTGVLLDEMSASLAKLQEQNKIIFRMLSGFKDVTNVQLCGLAATPSNPNLPEALITPSAITPPVSIIKIADSKATKKTKVAIITMQSNVSTFLGTEYNDILDIEIFKYKKGLPQFNKFEHIIMMTNGIGNAGVIDMQRQAGLRFHRINGAMTELRDVLTELYVACAPIEA